MPLRVKNLFFIIKIYNLLKFFSACRFGCGGWTTESTGLSFNNVLFRTTHRWDWDFVLRDLDGSTSGVANGVVVSKNNITIGDPACSSSLTYQNGVVCKNTVSWIRFAFNGAVPMYPVLMNFTDNRDDKVSSPFLAKRLTHLLGYMIALQANQQYLGVFDQAERPTNMSYASAFYGFKKGEFIIISHTLSQKPDRVFLFGSTQATESLSPLSGYYSDNGQWYWENSTHQMSFILLNKNKQYMDFSVSFNVYKCRFVGCERPQSPALKAPVTSRPPDALYWSNISTWVKIAQPGWGGFLGNNQFRLPQDGDSVLIPDGKYVVVDTNLPKIKYLYVEGVIELDNGRDHYLEANVIFINGGQFIGGWENDPISKNVCITLNGSKGDSTFILPNGIDIGTKAIGVYGGLDLHGE